MPDLRPYLSQEERRRTLIEAANRLFHKGGYEGITNMAVAHEAGVSRALVYNFFPDNAALRLAHFEDRVQHYQAAMDIGDSKELGPSDRIIATFRTMTSFTLADLLSLKEVMNSHGNNDLSQMQAILRRFTYERWRGSLEFAIAPPGLFPALWIFVDLTISMAICVLRDEMTQEGAESLLVALVEAALAELTRRL